MLAFLAVSAFLAVLGFLAVLAFLAGLGFWLVPGFLVVLGFLAALLRVPGLPLGGTSGGVGFRLTPSGIAGTRPGTARRARRRCRWPMVATG
jgi:hypothetical protein